MRKTKSLQVLLSLIFCLVVCLASFTACFGGSGSSDSTGTSTPPTTESVTESNPDQESESETESESEEDSITETESESEEESITESESESEEESITESESESEVESIPEVEITLSTYALELLVGDEEVVTATVTGSDDTLIWISSNEDIAVVDEEGVITAISAGQATITVGFGEYSATLTVTVSDVVEFVAEDGTIVLNAETWTDSKGNTYGETSGNVIVKLYVNGAEVDIAKTYTSINDKVATVSEDGVVTAIKRGKTEIEVTCEYEGQTYTQTVSVKVEKIYIVSTESFVFGGDKAEWVIDVEKLSLTAEDVLAIYLENGDDFVQVDEETGEIIFDGNKAQVITEGIDIESKTEADIVIVETEWMNVELKVAYVTQDNIEFVTEVSPMTIGKQKQIKLYAYGLPVEEDAEWSVDKEQIATIDENGVLTGVNYGTVVVTAKLYGYTYTSTQVVYDGGTTENTPLTVTNYVMGGTRTGYITVTKDYTPNDWVSVKFTVTEDISLESSMIFAYYGINNDGKEADFPNGIWAAWAGKTEYTSTGWDDSSFILLDSKGNKLGSFAKGTGYENLNQGETYELFVKIPDDGKKDHNLYVYFSSREKHDTPEHAMSGVIYWRDYLVDLAGISMEKTVNTFLYSGETLEEVEVDGNYIYNSWELGTNNTLDITTMGVAEEILSAKIAGSNADLFVTENGKPVVTDGKLTIKNDYSTFNGTSGMQTLILQTNNYKYLVNFEIVPTDDRFDNTKLIAEKITFLSGKEIVETIKAGKQLFTFSLYVCEDWIDGAYLHFEIGARHMFLYNDYIQSYSTGWDWARWEYVTSEFFRIYDENGTLINDTILMHDWSPAFGSVRQKMTKGNWYTVVIDLEGRAWGDDDCITYSGSAADVVATPQAGMSVAYTGNWKFISPAEFKGITLDKTAVVTREYATVTLTASLPEGLENKEITWSSSDETIATVENGVVTAHKAGSVEITATASTGKTAVCIITVNPVIKVQDGSEKEMTENFLNKNEDGSYSAGGLIDSWLPGTFDNQDNGNNLNICPTFVANEQFADYNVIRFEITVKEGGGNGFLHIYENNGTDVTKYVPDVARATAIGPNYYGKVWFWGTQPFAIANSSVLSIYDQTAEVLYAEDGIVWTEGHTYTLTYALKQGQSLMMWYTSALYVEDAGYVGALHKWNVPTFTYNVYEKLTLSNFRGAYQVGGTTVSITSPVELFQDGDEVQLTANVYGNLNKEVVWASSNEEVIAIDENTGVITCVGEGNAVITATSVDGAVGEFSITVLPKEIASYKDLNDTIKSWLPGTFDVGAAGSSTNVAPAYIPVANDMLGYGYIQFTLTINEGAGSGVLHLFDIASTDNTLWGDDLEGNIYRASTIGKGAVDGEYFNNERFTCFTKDELVIYDATADKYWSFDDFMTFNWTEGHTYNIIVKYAEGHSYFFAYSAQAAFPNGYNYEGFMNRWNNSTEYYDVLASITFGDIIATNSTEVVVKENA